MFGSSKVSADVRATVHEHRAPTEDSVRLLREMEAEARKRVLGAIHLAGCRIDAAVTVEHNHVMAELILHARANINGRDVTATHKVSTWELAGYQQQIEALHKLRDEFAAELAAVILAPHWPKVIGDVSGRFRK